MRHRIEKIFEREEVTERRMIGRDEISRNIELEKLDREHTRPRTGHYRENMSKEGRKCV